MSRYIDLDNILESVEHLKASLWYHSADVAKVKRGKWKHYPECSSRIVEVDECSECGYNYIFGDLYKYCPNCGAKMDGGEQT